MYNGQSAGKNFAYILGVYIGDGCITKPRTRNTYTFKLEVMDEDFAIKTKDTLIELECKTNFHKIENKRYKQGFSYHVTTVNKELIETLKNDTKDKTEVPPYVKGWSKENKLAFIAGIMDSEGFVSKRTKIMKNGLPSYMLGIKMDYNMLSQINPIFQSVGIKTGKYTMSILRDGQRVQTANLSLNIMSWISSNAHFNIKRKEDKIQDYLRNINLNDYTPNVQASAC